MRLGWAACFYCWGVFLSPRLFRKWRNPWNIAVDIQCTFAYRYSTLVQWDSPKADPTQFLAGGPLSWLVGQDSKRGIKAVTCAGSMEVSQWLMMLWHLKEMYALCLFGGNRFKHAYNKYNSLQFKTSGVSLFYRDNQRTHNYKGYCLDGIGL